MAVSLFVEVRRNVEAATIHLSANVDYLLEEVIIKYANFTITVSLFGQENVLKARYRYKLKSSETFIFKQHCPSSSNQTVFNFKSRPTNKIDVTARAEIKNKLDYQATRHSPMDDVGIPLEGSESSVKCRRCGNHVVDKLCFDKVFPLPSMEWQDIAGEWYCHKQPQDTEHLPKSRFIVPKERQCFTTESSIIFNENDVGNIHIQDSLVQCELCQCTIGKIETMDVGKVFIFDKYIVSVERFHRESGSTTFNAIPEGIVLRAASQHCATQRFLFSAKSSTSDNSDSSKDVDSSFLLVWVMDTCLEVLRGDSADQPLQVTSMDSLSSGNPHSCVVGLLKLQKMMKMLFRHVSPGDEILKSWEADINVRHVEINHRAFMEMVDRFKSSTERVPETARSADDFQVCYLDLASLDVC